MMKGAFFFSDYLLREHICKTMHIGVSEKGGYGKRMASSFMTLHLLCWGLCGLDLVEVKREKKGKSRYVVTVIPMRCSLPCFLLSKDLG